MNINKTKMKEFNLDNIKEVTIKDGTVKILHVEGITHIIKNLTNTNDSPNVDHCI